MRVITKARKIKSHKMFENFNIISVQAYCLQRTLRYMAMPWTSAKLSWIFCFKLTRNRHETTSWAFCKRLPVKMWWKEALETLPILLKNIMRIKVFSELYFVFLTISTQTEQKKIKFISWHMWKSCLVFSWTLLITLWMQTARLSFFFFFFSWLHLEW